MRIRIMVILLVTGLLLISSVTALAQEGDPAPCTGDNVSGMVVAIDAATGTVTVDTGEGALCTVTLSAGSYAHPIVSLLGQYFDDVNPAALAAALDALHVCALEDPATMTWSWVSCDTPGAVQVTVSGENPDGSFSATLDSNGDPITLLVNDPDQAGVLSDSLGDLLVSWQLGEDGSVLEAGDMIAAYHEDGMGFGVLVKLFAIAAESQEACLLMEEVDQGDCGVSVAELVAMTDQGMGIGQLFKLYGKPSILGVGHVKQQLREDKGKPPWAGPPGSDDGELPDGESPLVDEEKPNKKKDKNDPPGNSYKPGKPGKGKNKNK